MKRRYTISRYASAGHLFGNKEGMWRAPVLW